MHRREHLLQAETDAPERRVEAERVDEGLVHREPVAHQVPIPDADDRARRQRQLHALDVLPRHRLALPQRLFGPLAVGDVEHRADHPNRVPVRPADDVAAVQHLGIAAVGPAEAILARPDRLGPLDHRTQAALDPVPVHGMDLGRPPAHFRGHLRRGPAIRLLQRLVPQHALVAEIPIPDRVPRGPLRQPEPLVDRRQRLAGVVLLRAVTQHLEVAGLRAPLVAQRHHLARAPEPRPVLALMPAVVGSPALARRPLRLELRDARRLVLRREDQVAQPAEHLCLRPAQDVRRPDVPAGDLAPETHADDGKIDGAVQHLPP